ncbi:MAG: C40 family peptidase [Clostridiaceae bacterium]|nr:C40 family peptidase [Clostridiaceae bacterium]
MKNNIGLVEHSKKALAEEWGYVYGTFGKILTKDLLNSKLKQYPEQIERYKNYILESYIGKRTVDCVGLIKSFLWWHGADVVYDSSTDVSADGMFEAAGEKGSISAIPELPGVCVWKTGHVGIYVGNNQVIDARGTLDGVIISPLKGSINWTHWFKCPYIQYIESIPDRTWQEIIEMSTDHPDEWKKAIELIMNIANLEGTGQLQIFKYLPELINKVYNNAVDHN